MRIVIVLGLGFIVCYVALEAMEKWWIIDAYAQAVHVAKVK